MSININLNLTKYKECYLNKRAGGRHTEGCCVRVGVLLGKWEKRYFCITSEGITYRKTPNDNEIREMIIFDNQFQVFYGKNNTSYERGILLQSSNRNLLIECDNLFGFFDFLYSLKQATLSSPYLLQHRFASFSPERQQANCKWYVDGEDYFKDVCKYLNEASREIFITDWWLSPHLYLMRPVSEKKNQQSRLDRILMAAAEKGVQINIIHWQEHTLVMTNKSYETKNYLESLHNNIKMLRHPNYTLPYPWSHHEKMVIIDQTVGFLGGLDLCYGRYDNQKHQLFDDQHNEDEFWPGIDYNNSRTKDFTDVFQHEKSDLQKNIQHRMPWHDVAMRVIGEPVIDMCRHFIQYWNHVVVDIQYEQKQKNLLYNTANDVSAMQKLKQQFTAKSRIQQSESSDSIQPDENQFQYVRPLVQQIDQEQLYIDQIKQNQISSKKDDNEEEEKKDDDNKRISVEYKKYNTMLNKNISLQTVSSQSLAKSQISVNQNQQNQTEFKKNKIKSKSVFQDEILKTQGLEKEFVEMIEDITKKKYTQDIMNDTDIQFARKQKFIISEMKAEGQMGPRLKTELTNNQQIEGKQGNCNVQMLRSASLWSLGIQSYEESIHFAYIHLIGQAQHYIYIENQFFISKTAGDEVKNEISRALIARIKQAHRLQEKFKVFVVLPLLPGFSGEIDQQANVMKIQLDWEYKTISRGGTSIIETLRDLGISDPLEYINFYGLRTHGCIVDKDGNSGKPCTEIVYVHSKLLIIDDLRVLMGSANINDRSLIGDRDSEIAMVVEDELKIQSKMNEKEYQASKFALELRKKLFSEHFGLKENEVQDPLDKQFLETISKNTIRNTEIYRVVFGCYPDDTIKIISDVAELKKKADVLKYDSLKDKIIGNAVEFPLYFLSDEKLNKLNWLSKENIPQTINWV